MTARFSFAPGLFGAALVAGSMARVAPARAQAPVSGAFVVTLGADTETVEQFVRTGNTVVGDIVTRQPATVLTHYTLTLGPSGMPARLEFTRERGDGSPLPAGLRSGSMTFGADSVVSSLMAGGADTAIVRGAAAAHGLPYIPHAFSFYQYAVDAMRASGADSLEISMVPPGSRQRYPFPMLRRGGSEFVVYFFNDATYPQRVAVDGSGRITAVDARATTEKVVAHRVAGVDIQQLAAAFARADASGHAMGLASPRDTAAATAGAAHLWIDYGRPAARGRKVFGASGVLGDTLWRTGANAATQFRTDVDLEIGGRTLPAGMYTLWMSAHPGRYALIFNKQTGQWGTEHDATQDLFAVPLAEHALSDLVERFTIVIDGAAGGTGALRFRWDRTELSIPFRVK